MNFRTKSTIFPSVVILSDSVRVFFLCRVASVFWSIVSPRNSRLSRARLLDTSRPSHTLRYEVIKGGGRTRHGVGGYAASIETECVYRTALIVVPLMPATAFGLPICDGP
jgi:hypothetical protein